MINVLIADDHAIVRTGLRALLRSEPDLQLAGEATGGYDAIELVGKTRPISRPPHPDLDSS
jgi:YesN/AraC family two-component response regulator